MRVEISPGLSYTTALCVFVGIVGDGVKRNPRMKKYGSWDRSISTRSWLKINSQGAKDVSGHV